MAQYNGPYSYVEYKPELIWNQRNGWQKLRTFHGIYNVLSALAENTRVLHESTKNSANPQESGLFDIDLSQPDPSGYAVLKITYLRDLMYQWTLTQNLIETSLYLQSGSINFVNDLPGATLEDKSVQYTRLVNGVELAFNQGATFTFMLTGDPTGITSYTAQDSQSISYFRNTYNLLNAGQKDYVKYNLYSVRLKGIDSFPVIQQVLKKQYVFGDYDLPLPDIDNGVINRAYSRLAIANHFGGPGTPIPTTIYNQMPDYYWIFVGVETQLLNTGKIQATAEWWYANNYEPIIYGSPILT